MSLKRPNLLRRWLADHARVSVASFGRHWRDPVGSLLTALVIGITLALPAGLHLLVQNLQTAAGGLNQTRGIQVFLRDRVGATEGQQLADALAQRTQVQEARYTSREQALADFRARTQLDPVLDALGENPLPASIALVPAENLDAAGMERLAAELRERGEVEHVQLDSGWSARLSAALALATRLAWVLAVALGLAAVLAMSNTIRLDIEARREEILVMKLVGASSAFIRRPFLYAGFWYGLGGSLMALLALYVARYALEPPVAALVALYEGAFTVRGPDLRTLGGVLGAGVLLGLLGAWLGVSRHLGRVEPR